MLNQKHSYVELQELQNLSLEDKISRAQNLAQTELQYAKNPGVACSFGKASMVMAHLVLTIRKDACIIFHNTGVQYKETYEFRDKILAEWNIENFHETKPIMSFWNCVKKYGYPQFRNKDTRTPKCCYYLKEKPARVFIKKQGIDLEFVGLQASESMMRRWTFFREGEAFNSKSYGCRIVRPLMIWKDVDMWQYHKQFDIPINPLYEKMKRNGCMTCTGFKGWRRQLAKTNLKLYHFISRDMGQSLLSDYGCKGDIGY